jgi:hypothetical protein
MENPEDSKPMNSPACKERETQTPTPAEQPALREIPDTQPWREIAAQAASETDPQRLSRLVDELIRLLDEERRSRGGPE